MTIDFAITTRQISDLQYELLANNVKNIIAESEAEYKTISALGMKNVTFYKDATKKGIQQSIRKILAPGTSVVIYDTSINEIVYSVGDDSLNLSMTTEHIQTITSQKTNQYEFTLKTPSDKTVQVLAAYSVFPDWNWTIVSFVDKDRLFKYSNQAITLSIAIGSILFIAILIIIFWLFNRFSRAIVALEDGAYQLSTDDKYDEIDLPGSDEFSLLAGSFNRMAIDIRSKEQQLKRSIVEEKKANISLLESRNLYHDLIENTPNFVTKVNLKGRITFVNRAAVQMFGVLEKDCIGKRAFDFIHLDDQESTKVALSLWLKSDEDELVYENRQLGADSTIYYIICSIYREYDRDNQLRGFVCTGVDRTDYKLSILENAVLEKQLLQSQKMQAVGQLAGGIAHDFNNMLGVILSHAQIAKKRSEPSSPSFSNLEGIIKAARHSADLTRQLLTFARKQNIAPEVINLNESINSMLDMLKLLVGENIELTFEQATNLWSINVDPTQINQVITNLCVNARDAIETVGEITIVTKNYSVDDQTVKILNNELHSTETNLAVEPHRLPSGDYVRLSVQDSGKGMNKEVITHIFEPFFTTKDVGKGTGLGLSIVFGAIKQNYGFIEISSEPNKGTIFHIYFLKENNAEAKDTDVITSQSLFGSETILLVEDDKMLLEVEILMLEEYGYRVLSATTTNQAQELAQQHIGQIDLLLTDIVMPEMNGKDLATKLTAADPKMKVLYMSGYADNIIGEQNILRGDVHFLPKPFESDILVAKLREVLDSTDNLIKLDGDQS
ncbi:MAG: two-component system cell cycle sensor histidine kinase/response regulator CckA [Enterobacterales bacterium]|jgi:two-component system cell cycle sensor histidine kinase/response regulator CckA